MTLNHSGSALRYTIKGKAIIEETLRECSGFDSAEYVQTKSIPFEKILPRDRWVWTNESTRSNACIARLRQLLVMFSVHCADDQSHSGQKDTNVTVVINMVDNTSRIVMSTEVSPRIRQTITRVGELLVLHGGEYYSCHQAKCSAVFSQHELPFMDRYNDTYVLDANTYSWKKLVTHNPPPPSSGHEARELSTTQLLIWGDNLSIPYILDLVSLEWSPEPMMLEAYGSLMKNIQSTDYIHKDSLDEHRNEDLRYREQMQTRRREHGLI